MASQLSDIKSLQNINANKKLLLYVQDSFCLVLGIGAGILQLESIQGFAMFGIGYAVLCAVYICCLCRFRPSSYYENPIQDILLDSFFRELTGFIMTWTFSYALVG